MKTMKKNEWNALTRAEKRVLLAQDTIKWIKTGRIQPTSGEVISKFYNYSHSKWKDKQAKKELEKAGRCEVCAKGGFLYSKAMRVNCVTVPALMESYERQDYYNTNYKDNFMSDCFSQDQWRILELHFEGWLANSVRDFYDTMVDPIEEDDSSDYTNLLTLLFLCLNLIHNKGRFKIPDNTSKQQLFHDNVVMPYLEKTKEFKGLYKKLMEIKTP